MTPSNNITRLFILLSLFMAWLAAISFQGLDVRTLFSAQFFLLVAALISFYQLPTASIKFPINSLVIILVLFWLWILFAPNWSLSPHISQQHIWIIGLLPATFFICQFSSLTDKHWYFFITATIATGTLLAIHAIYQVSTTELQATSLFLNRNSFAALLNLIILSGIALLFIYSLQQPPRKHIIPIIIAIFIMAYAIGLTQSRGAVISLYSALAILFFSTRSSVPLKLSLAIIVLITLAVFMPNLHVSGSDIATRLQTLNDPYTAGSHRFYIWESSWEMIKTFPWLGIGAGMFWLVYPQYRSPQDVTSGGFYVHNDYLQVWVENGLPAFILLCSLLIIVLVYFIRKLKTETNHSRKIEIAGIFSGLFAISLHSLVTFNYYILSILILSGIFLARFNHLCLNDSTRFITIDIKNKSRLFLALTTLIFVLISNSLFSKWQSDNYRKQALSLIEKNNYVVADQMLGQATKLHPSEGIYLTRAFMLIKLLQQTPSHATGTKQILFDTALSTLEKAAALNPYRSYHYLVKGRLYAENPQFGGNYSYEQAKNAFNKSLQLDPRQYRAHYALALLYARNDSPHQASKLLNEGLDKPLIKKIKNKLPYLQLALRVNHSVSNTDAVYKIAEMIRTKLPSRAEPYTLDEIIKNIVNSNTSDYNFNEYDDSSESRIKM